MSVDVLSRDKKVKQMVKVYIRILNLPAVAEIIEKVELVTNLEKG